MSFPTRMNKTENCDCTDQIIERLDYRFLSPQNHARVKSREPFHCIMSLETNLRIYVEIRKPSIKLSFTTKSCIITINFHFKRMIHWVRFKRSSFRGRVSRPELTLQNRMNDFIKSYLVVGRIAFRDFLKRIPVPIF